MKLLATRTLPISFAVAVLAVILAASGRADEPPLSHVGLSKVDITPDYPVRLNGFGSRREESEGVTQRIFAKAIAISGAETGQEGGEPVVIVTVDNLGIRLSMVEEVARRLEEKVGLRRERFAVTFSHSHTTPKVNGASDTIFSSPIPPEHQERIDRYTRELTDWIEEAALQALASRKPARLSWSVGTVGFAKNRRTPGGPVDHDLPTLVVRDAEDDSVRGIYVSYACHCVTLSDNKISGDWAGFAQAAIEDDHPGAICLTSIGCGSDANPDSGVAGARADLAAAQGDAIRAEVARLLERAQKPVGGPIASRLNLIDLPLNELPTREQLEATAAQDGPAGYSAQWHLDKLDRGEELMTAIRYPIQTFTFGHDLAVLFLAGEVCVDYSHRLKRELDRDRLWINAYANDFCSYIPSERLVVEGGYGGGAEMVYFGVPATLKPGLEALIVDEVHRQVPNAFSAVDDPQRTGGSRPLTPTASRDAIELPDGFMAELVACEPLVIDPVAIDFGPDGKLWVCEMHDYPEGLDGKYAPGGRIRFLEDTDGDGRFDRATLFADGLPFPTGVSVWRDGVLACAAPDVLYLEDTDGDGVADKREVVLSGFATHNYQARVNSLRLGLDGWIYAAVGLFGGEIESPRNGSRLQLNGRDFRFRPDTGEIEPASGNSQQGRVRDDWGRWFGCTNGSLIKHYPLADHYLRRNPHLAPPPVEQDVLAGTGFSRLFPARSDPQLFKLSGAAGGVTSACGIEIYRDTLLGDEFAGDAFTCEPVNLVVHRSDLLVKSDGIGVTAAAPAGEREFLASTDRWFRPVQARTGPDGALWIADMYRFIIEHPRWIPEETLESLDVRAGSTMGRIYRVFPANRPPRPFPRLDRLATPELAAALDTPNGTLRDLAMQMLLWRDDPAALTPLERLATNPDALPEVRVQALCTLDGLNALASSHVLAALRSPHPGIRRHAARRCERRLADDPTLHAPFLALADDPDPEVRMQVAASLGEWNDPAAGRALAGLLQRERDPYVTGAALSSALPQLEVILDELLASSPPPPALAEVISLAAATLPLDRLAPLAERIAGPDWPSTHAVMFLDALARRGLPADEAAPLHRAFTPLAKRARRKTANERAGENARLESIALLARIPAEAEDDAAVLLALLRPDTPLSIQSAAVVAMQRLSGSAELEGETGAQLLVSSRAASPALRAQLLDALLSRPGWTRQLLARMQDDPELAAALDPARRQALLSHTDAQIAKLATELFEKPGGPSHADRTQLIATYREGMRGNGDVAKGEAVFQRACAACHQLGGIGLAVGPDLATLSDKSPAALLAGILDPNRAVLDQFRLYILTLRDGQTASGIISQETASTIVLTQLDGTTREILRKDIATLESTGRSMMPEGLEAAVSIAEMNDLLAFLGVGAPPRK